MDNLVLLVLLVVFLLPFLSFGGRSCILFLFFANGCEMDNWLKLVLIAVTFFVVSKSRFHFFDGALMIWFSLLSVGAPKQTKF